VVSEEYAQSQLRSPDAKVRRFQGQAHEIGHFWWMLTDSTTPDNWIDEALAEFFALQAVEEFFGDGSTREILKKYQSDIMGTTDSKPILETIRSDQAAYVLFYEKGAMIFRMLKDMLGEERLFQILKAFYSSQKGTQDATTEDLLGTFGRETDLNLESFFNQFLNANFLPSLEAVWEGSRHNVVSGNIVLNNAGFETFPLEITFIKLDKRTLAISPGDNRFEFRLPVAPDMMLLDEDNALLKGKYSVTKKK
jgi:aminopeptidase N